MISTFKNLDRVNINASVRNCDGSAIIKLEGRAIVLFTFMQGPVEYCKIRFKDITCMVKAKCLKKEIQ